MKTNVIVNKFESLSPDSQKEVVDFIDFLQTRNTPRFKRKRKFKSNLLEDSFIGMWKDREDLYDSSAWVKSLRQKEW